MSRAIPMVGETFGKLLVLRAAPDRGYAKYWVCRCECGVELETQGGHLRGGASSSCKPCSSTTHGQSHTGIYRSWANMRKRCRLNSPGYENITYPKEWESFETFVSDMGGTYFEGAAIDRIDNAGNYCKENCQWLTITEHATKSANERWRK